MDLQTILERFAEAIPAVDLTSAGGGYNQRTGELYLPGVKTLREPDFVEATADWWQANHPEDFESGSIGNFRTGVDYKNTKRAKIDLLHSAVADFGDPDWAIEVKHIALVGNNGKTNDFGVGKLLSPYLKDRSLKHDIERLNRDPFCEKQAVIGYGFDYSFDTLALAAELHPNSLDVISNIREVCHKVNPETGLYSVLDLVDFADDIFANTGLGLVKRAIKVPFRGAWRHPAGGDGWVFGWELN